jgi:hypothetical protein
MKPSYTFLICLLLTALGCSKKNAVSSPFHLQLNSILYSFDTVSVSVDTSLGFRNASIYCLDTKTGSTFHIEMQSDTSTLVGSYLYLTAPPGDYFYTFSLVIRSGQNATSYTVTANTLTFDVTTDSNMKISGKFSGTVALFSGNGTAAVTNGQFDLPYSY